MTVRPWNLALPVLVLALAGCAVPAVDVPPTDSTGADDSCAEVLVVVDFGVLDAQPIEQCVTAGAALDVLADAGVVTEGTVDFGDQIVCRVNDRPGADETVTIDGQEPFTESCTSMPAATAYWALWVMPNPDADWEYAQEGVATLELSAGQSLGLVYTSGDESTPPLG